MELECDLSSIQSEELLRKMVSYVDTLSTSKYIQMHLWIACTFNRACMKYVYSHLQLQIYCDVINYQLKTIGINSFHMYVCTCICASISVSIWILNLNNLRLCLPIRVWKFNKSLLIHRHFMCQMSLTECRRDELGPGVLHSFTMNYSLTRQNQQTDRQTDTQTDKQPLINWAHASLYGNGGITATVISRVAVDVLPLSYGDIKDVDYKYDHWFIDFHRWHRLLKQYNNHLSYKYNRRVTSVRF